MGIGDELLHHPVCQVCGKEFKNIHEQTVEHRSSNALKTRKILGNICLITNGLFFLFSSVMVYSAESISSPEVKV